MSETIDVFGNLGATLHSATGEVAKRSAVAYDTATGAAVIFRHRDVAAITKDPRVGSIGLSMFDLMGITGGPLREWYGSVLFTNDGDAHRRLRLLVSHAFTPRSAEKLRAAAAELATQCLISAPPDGEVDLVKCFELLPTRLMCRLLGVPDSDAPALDGWLKALSRIFLMMTPEEIDAATRSIVDLLGYLDELTRARGVRPGADLITALLNAQVDGQRLRPDEVVSMVANLLVAGHDTTTGQIGCTLWVLLGQPDRTRRAVEQAIPPAYLVAETTRLEPGIPLTSLTAIEPLEVDGHAIPAGTMLLPCIATANRDPDVWSAPDEFDPGRFTRPGVPTQLTFGAGPHYCLGGAQARVTVEECVRAVLATEPWLELTESPAEIPWRVVLGRTPQRLSVRRPG